MVTGMAAVIDIQELLSILRGKRVGIIATPAGWIPGYGTLLDFLPREVDVCAFLALEHGLRGDLQDGVHFDAYKDSRTGIPVYSFYGGSHTFPEECMRSLDVLVFHAQDVSHRAYTYKQTLAETLQLASRTGTEVVILDRPTPLAHLGAQGMCHSQFFPVPIPVVLPVTLGELGLWLVRETGLACRLSVVPVKGWSRQTLWNDTGLPWIPPSPNIPTLDCVYAYACAGYLQHTTISEGRGTCKPFEYFGAPYVDPFILVQRLNRAGLPGLVFREVYFTPAFNKYAGELCGGVHLMITDARAVDPVRTGFWIMRSLAECFPEAFKPTAGFAQWFDGLEWTNERILATDPEAFVVTGTEQADAFAQSIDTVALYRNQGSAV